MTRKKRPKRRRPLLIGAAVLILVLIYVVSSILVNLGAFQAMVGTQNEQLRIANELVVKSAKDATRDKHVNMQAALAITRKDDIEALAPRSRLLKTAKKHSLASLELALRAQSSDEEAKRQHMIRWSHEFTMYTVALDRYKSNRMKIFYWR